MKAATCSAIGAALFLTGLCGCVKAPEKIDIRVGDRGYGSSSDRVNPANMPNPQTLDEAREELRKAYATLNDLEKDNRKARDKAEEYKQERDKARRERDEMKRKLKWYEDQKD